MRSGSRGRWGSRATDVAKVRTAAALHDVGKLHTPREILNKPGRLTGGGVRGDPPPPR